VPGPKHHGHGPWRRRRHRQHYQTGHPDHTRRGGGDGEVAAAAAAATARSTPVPLWLHSLRAAAAPRPSPLRAGLHCSLAACKTGPLARTHQKSAGARSVLGTHPLHTANGAGPVRRIY